MRPPRRCVLPANRSCSTSEHPPRRPAVAGRTNLNTEIFPAACCGVSQMKLGRRPASPAAAGTAFNTNISMQIGIDSFVATNADPVTGVAPSPVQRITDLLEEIALADQVGLDVFGIGEH